MLLKTASATLGLVLCWLPFMVGAAELSPAVASLLDELEPDAQRPFSAAEGDKVWHAVQSNDRSCMSCHSESLYVQGRHERTGKVIEPMAPSVNSDRLTDRKKIKKWFLRNCKWTFGRECTAQEKGDILVWLSDQ